MRLLKKTEDPKNPKKGRITKYLKKDHIAQDPGDGSITENPKENPVTKNHFFVKFTGNQLCLSLFLMKLQLPCNFVSKDSNTNVFL